MSFSGSGFPQNTDMAEVRLGVSTQAKNCKASPLTSDLECTAGTLAFTEHARTGSVVK